MDIALDTLETAVYAALAPLAASATPAGPFVHVGRWTGEARAQGGVVSLTRESLARNPALLLEGPSERAAITFEGLEGAGSIETRGTVTFILWVIVHDARGSQKLLKGATSTRGSLYLVDAVIARLNGLEVTSGGSPALYRSTTLRYLGHTAPLVDPATHRVARLEFSADRSVPTVAVTDTTRDLLGLTADVNNTQPPVPEPADETAPGFNPLASFRADT